MNDEGWWLQAVEGFCWLTDLQTDICECRVVFATDIYKLCYMIYKLPGTQEAHVF